MKKNLFEERTLFCSPLFSQVTNLIETGNNPEIVPLWFMLNTQIGYIKVKYENSVEKVDGLWGEVMRAFGMVRNEEKEITIRGKFAKIGFAKEPACVGFFFGKEVIKITISNSHKEESVAKAITKLVTEKVEKEIGDTYDRNTIKVMQSPEGFQILIPFEKIEFAW